MKNIEQNAFDVLSQKPYKVTLGGKSFQFNRISMNERQEIAAIAARLELQNHLEAGVNMPEGEALTEAINCGKYGKEIAEIVSIIAHTKGFCDYLKKWRRDRIFKAAYFDATTEEIAICINKFLDQVEPAFFLSILISLNRQNILKPTKEIEATALG
ncbi:hypothetical protein AGMMS49525_11710 [Bacteroidia bacterium]|nr:hypothetical protein AGMMS49525_11710 [Bacteroidia bacterium]